MADAAQQPAAPSAERDALDAHREAVLGFNQADLYSGITTLAAMLAHRHPRIAARFVQVMETDRYRHRGDDVAAAFLRLHIRLKEESDRRLGRLPKPVRRGPIGRTEPRPE